ncbi:MAG TPA: 50S ribosomal protein L24 [Candidatus Nanoarchaeia archaeon]|nr:50S ribosomal protein L24 [Candidatus Nanoarchaeia archaeon]
MKQVFSKNWKSSKQPRKQRKYSANAPLHLRKNFVSVNISKELRKKHNKRSLPLRKNDYVKIMRGKFKGKKGKVLNINSAERKIEIEKIHLDKRDGSKANAKFKPSNLQITELNMDDARRLKDKSNKKTKKQEDKEKQTKNKSNKKSE